MSSRTRYTVAQGLLGAVDLAIDFATLGQYGLESPPAGGRCRERPGRRTGWEALSTARPRGDCPPRDAVGAKPTRP